MGFLLGSMIRVHFFREDMEHPVASNAVASAVPLPAYERQDSIQDLERRFLSRSLIHPTIVFILHQCCQHCKDILWIKKQNIKIFEPAEKKNLTKLKLFSMISDTKELIDMEFRKSYM